MIIKTKVGEKRKSFPSNMETSSHCDEWLLTQYFPSLSSHIEILSTEITDKAIVIADDMTLSLGKATSALPATLATQ